MRMKYLGFIPGFYKHTLVASIRLTSKCQVSHYIKIHKAVFIFQLLDEPGGVFDDYFLGKTLLNNGSVALKFSDVLE